VILDDQRVEERKLVLVSDRLGLEELGDKRIAAGIMVFVGLWMAPK